MEPKRDSSTTLLKFHRRNINPKFKFEKIVIDTRWPRRTKMYPFKQNLNASAHILPSGI